MAEVVLPESDEDWRQVRIHAMHRLRFEEGLPMDAVLRIVYGGGDAPAVTP